MATLAAAPAPDLREKGLEITLDHGVRHYFNYYWLRDNCATSFDAETRERVYDIFAEPAAPRPAQAEIVAERVMGIFETLEITVAEQPITLSISMGAASVNHSVGGFEVLLGMADAALFRAKAKGRGGYLFGDIPSPIPFPSPKKVAAEMRS